MGNYFTVALVGNKYTTRDGSHTDDELYRSQLEEQFQELCDKLEFKDAEIVVTLTPLKATNLLEALTALKIVTRIPESVQKDLPA